MWGCSIKANMLILNVRFLTTARHISQLVITNISDIVSQHRLNSRRRGAPEMKTLSETCLAQTGFIREQLLKIFCWNFWESWSKTEDKVKAAAHTPARIYQHDWLMDWRSNPTPQSLKELFWFWWWINTLNHTSQPLHDEGLLFFLLIEFIWFSSCWLDREWVN